MPRKSNTEPTLQSWDEVDQYLRRIAEHEIALNEVEAKMNIAINDAKEEAAQMGKPIKESITRMEQMVKEYVENKKSEIEGKSKQLTFGEVGFRHSSRVIIAAKKADAIIKNLKRFGMEDCISVKEAINKEALERYQDDDIAKVGASRKVEDKFRYETYKEKIQG